MILVWGHTRLLLALGSEITSIGAQEIIWGAEDRTLELATCKASVLLTLVSLKPLWQIF